MTRPSQVYTSAPSPSLLRLTRPWCRSLTQSFTTGLDSTPRLESQDVYN